LEECAEDDEGVMEAVRARSGAKTIEIRVELLERRGPIEPGGFPWAEVSSSGKIRYTYPDEWHSRRHRFLAVMHPPFNPITGSLAVVIGK
jgi:hypothetical protein